MRLFGEKYHTRLLCGVAYASLMAAAPAHAQDVDFNIPSQSLSAALDTFAAQSRQPILVTPDMTAGKVSRGVAGPVDTADALGRLLEGTGLTWRLAGKTFLIVQQEGASGPQGGSAGDVDALIVTAQKREENIQDVPIAISAFSQETLTERQVAGGPDLITQIPNMSFTKTNFTSYSIQIRGIGTQAISATTDPAVAVAFNNTPFIRNRFFEQEFYDLERLEVLRGPQGTLYGRNATAGVVNLISAKPKFIYEAKVSADVGNYSSRRIEGMVNIPLVEDAVALRVAGAWTQRDGYALNQMTGAQIDGRDLWSTRVSLRFEPTDWISANLIWEHFQEDDDRLRSGKQLCKKDITTEVGGIAIPYSGNLIGGQTFLSQGCAPVSLYSEEAFQTPNGFALPYWGPLSALGNPVKAEIDPYRNALQSRDLRVIESSVEPDYRAQTDIAELQISVDIGDHLTLNSETSYGADSLFSLQDFNRFTTTPGVFDNDANSARTAPGGVFCDPQLGCSDRMILVDLSTSDSSQFSQEFRLSSDFDGPVNFSLGVNYLRHDAEDKYYVFVNTLSLYTAYNAENSTVYIPGVTDNNGCFRFNYGRGPGVVGDTAPIPDPNLVYGISFDGCTYIDPNPIGALNDQGRNYFLSKNPYKLISYAAFGELYYNITDDLKLTAGLRLTDDRKTAPQIPSWLLAQFASGPYPTSQTLFQEWREPTGRLAIDWKPHLSFTDETLVYASYAHGYKAGGANPPPPVLVTYSLDDVGPIPNEILPDTFGPEFVDAFEIGTKNTAFGGALTLNLTGFYYDYKGYQTSEIRNRAAVNSNYDAEVWGAEIEADWRLTDALRLGFRGGYNMTSIGDGQEAIDLMDRTAGREDWVVVRPFPSIPSNCVLPVSVVTAGGEIHAGGGSGGYNTASPQGVCLDAWYFNNDPVTMLPYKLNPTVKHGAISGAPDAPLGPSYANYPGFNPQAYPEANGGRGFTKPLGGNELPNAPNYTATVTADYSLPLRGDWLLNLHGDYHYQSESWGRVFNSDPYDRIEGFSTVNLAGIFTNEDAGWKVMAYVKNVFDETAITGTFLNSDDTGLTTNVFLTEPRLYGLRVTKDFTGGGWLGDFGRRHEGPYAFTVELGGGVGRYSAEAGEYAPQWLDLYSPAFPLPSVQDEDLDWGDMRSVKLTYAPLKDWRASAAYRFGKTNGQSRGEGLEHVPGGELRYMDFFGCFCLKTAIYDHVDNHLRVATNDSEEFAIVDFMVGKEMGVGAIGDAVRSLFGIGIRYAELTSVSHVMMDGLPDGYVIPYAPLYTQLSGHLHRYTTSLDSDRGFEGVGPALSWEASMRLFGNEDAGHADLDWSVTGGVLFGKQTLDSAETRWGRYYSGIMGQSGVMPLTTLYDDVVPRHRSENITVPNLSLTLGLSYSVDRIKVSTGYSYDRFFDAIDGGVAASEQFDRTIHGPFVKLSVGFGG